MKRGALMEMVLWCLINYKPTRDSDTRLTINIWNKFFPEYVTWRDDRPYICLYDLFNVPRGSDIVRKRAKVQNNKKKPDEERYLPISPEVRKARRIKEEDCRVNKGQVN